VEDGRTVAIIKSRANFCVPFGSGQSAVVRIYPYIGRCGLVKDEGQNYIDVAFPDGETVRFGTMSCRFL